MSQITLRLEQAREAFATLINEYADILAPQKCAIHGITEPCDDSCLEGDAPFIPMDDLYLAEWVLVTSFRQFDNELLAFNTALWPKGQPPHHRRGLLTEVLEDRTV